MQLEGRGGTLLPSTSATDVLDLQGDNNEEVEDKDKDEERRRKVNKRAEITAHEPIPYFPFCSTIREARLTQISLFQRRRRELVHRQTI